MFMIRRIRLTSSATSNPKIRAVPAGRQQQRGQDLDERRLARAVGPEQAEELAGRDLEVDAVEGDDRLGFDVVDAAHTARLDGRRAGPDGHASPRARRSVEGLAVYLSRGRAGRLRRAVRRLRRVEAASCARDAGVVDDQGGVRAQRSAPFVMTAIRASSHGVSARPGDARRPRLRGRLARSRRGRRRRGWPRPRAAARTRGSQVPSPEAEVRPDEVGRGLEVGDTCSGAGMPDSAGEEPGQLGLPDRHDRHAARLEVLERGRDVEDRLRPGADDGHRGAPELVEVRRDVERGRGRGPGFTQRPAMDAADPAGREDPDARRHAPGSSSPRPSSPPNRRRRNAAASVGRAALRTEPAGRRRERLRARFVQADQDPAGVDRDGRGDGAGLADRRLGRMRDLEVLRVRQAVADERRLEGHDGAAVGERARDLGRDLRSGRQASPRRVPVRCPPALESVRDAAEPPGSIVDVATLWPMPTRRAFDPEDIRRQVVLEEHDLVRRWPAGRGRSPLRPAAIATSPTCGSCRSVRRAIGRGRAAPGDPLTSGIVQDRQPALSPDGGLVACDPLLARRRRPPDGHPPDRHARRPDPRDPRAARTAASSELAWSPDGSRLAFTGGGRPAAVPRRQAPAGRGTTAPRGTAGSAPARPPHHPVGLALRRASGHLDHWSHLFVVDVRDGLTPAPGDRPATGASRGIAWQPGRPDRGVRERSRPASRTSGRGRRSGRWTSTRRERRATRGPRAGRWREPAGVLAGWPLDRRRRGPRGRAARRRQPGPARRSGRRLRTRATRLAAGPRPPDRRTGWTPTSPAGWSTSRTTAMLARLRRRSSRSSPTAAGRSRGRSRWTRRPASRPARPASSSGDIVTPLAGGLGRRPGRPGSGPTARARWSSRRSPATGGPRRRRDDDRLRLAAAATRSR